VLHFALSMKAEGVRIVESWRAHGMRGTGSHDVEIAGAFVPDSAISARRVPGRWGPLFHTIYLIAFPIVYSVYVGVAEAARDIAVRHVKGKPGDPLAVLSVGELDTELTVAQLALEKMIDLAETAEPGPEVTNTCLRCRSIAGSSAIRSVDKAVECVGGQAFSRSFGLERLWRDVQGARFHALQGKPQALYSGRIALGLDVDGD
jgi:alkylation response protein AidB-like acyl-CoA dehydrogenase